MEKHLLDFIKDKVHKDSDLCNFYNTFIEIITDSNLDEYIDLYCEESKDKIENTVLKDLRKYILGRIRNTRSRLRKKIDFEGRLIDYPDIDSLKDITKKSIFDNELLLLITDSLDSYKKDFIEITERPKSLDGMYSTKEKITLYNTDNKIAIGDRTGFVSDEKYIRNKNVMQPVYISGGPSIETVLVSKNDTVYCKSKSLDAIDQKIMDFLIDEYKKIMYFQDDQLKFPLSKISMVAFNNANNRLLKRTQERLTKMSTHGFKVYEEESNSINDYEIVNMFEIKFITDDDGTRRCLIDLSGSNKRDLRTKNTIMLYKHKLDQITNNFTAIFVNYLQNQRVYFGLNGKLELDIPFEVLNLTVMLPYVRNKAKNLAEIKKSLQELKDMDFIVEDYKIKGTTVHVKFYKLEYMELKKLQLVDKAKELEV